MNLYNFQSQIDPIILERGIDYYASGNKEGYIVPVFVRTRKDVRRFSQAAGRLKTKLGIV